MRAAWIVAIWGVICLGAGIYGFEQAREQQRRLERYEAAPAVVLSKDVVYASGGRYRGLVEYRYEAGGIGRTGNELTALPWRGTAREIEGLLSEVPLGRPVTAFYDPRRPGESYLLRRVRLWPFAMMLSAGFGVALLWGVVTLGGVLDGSPRPVTRGPSGWYRLRERWSMGRRAGWWLGVFAAGVVYGVLVGWMCWSVFEARDGQGVGMIFGLYGVWCVCLGVVGMVCFFRAQGQVGAWVSATLPALRVDLPVHVRVELSGGERKRKVEQVTAALACVERKGLLSRERSYFASARVGGEVVLTPGQVYVKEVSFDVPTLKRHGSTAWSAWGYPRREWEVWVTVGGKEWTGNIRKWSLVLE
ncbi:MAG: hypothetical protein IT442_13775 [Phycisphaeraceae bacterium]|nr:hypothetical protein [Phycisphaeraceae bacterium]